MVFIISCKKTVPFTPVSPTNVEFFSLSENKVKNGDVININLTTGGVYTLTMIDTVQNQVVSRERFTEK
jgi:DNA helicase TIP49 (TBP-interacting protein)